MSAGAQPQSSGPGSKRRVLRYQVQAPLDVTVLRQGVPHTLPGRALNLCERGIAAVLSGEVLPGEAVGVEVQPPFGIGPLRARALVRHHDRLRCGMEFVGLTAEQEAFLRQWVERAKPKPEQASAERPPKLPEKTVKPSIPNIPTSPNIRTTKKLAPYAKPRRSVGWVVVPVLVAILIAGFWWRWNQGWQQLESSLGIEKPVVEQPQAQVPAEVMEKLVTHRVDPEYPEAARQAKIEGVVVLDVVIGRDGSVVSMHPVNGPDVLTTAAMDALRWWRFTPYQIDGKPVAVETKVAVEFHP